MKIVIIDYGMGNIHSVAKSIQVCGVEPIISNKKSEISSADKIVLPGVGAFDDAMLELKKLDLISVILRQVDCKKPFLGICLGMQLLLESSQEAEMNKGLGIIKGQVVKFNSAPGLKVPHMGWNDCKVVAKDCLLLSGISSGTQVYFCHSYYPQPSDKSVIAATSNYGGEFCCVLRQGNVYGVQFHPEKSQALGLKIIKNFVNLC
ncbi:MAG: imidazole glycerol phosphate synthase subunit HisH [Candidatus Omnitrophica bacterium]|nr:imidazole glycerol phosphate synthase subunit HisH [Candidatus Omnitrophota bacterium]MBU4303727.1 imidazole glycerol phosphate synthase subunit HisH [Candidatus Omnitrophota bacterium]MBU4419269.1 imidazole glycerol phosphate synthase subunit HisH [Candidatus Omnitrophota bacterium]MBU4468500.1 imidazole glycerol phosphate synthase subunit HisH [Candidatus Omnitrophota bacterium]MCG2707675.1 imidazole glycerol phosphate synthase subunit HisH [Candidatus Omnitrophota bacterium]